MAPTNKKSEQHIIDRKQHTTSIWMEQENLGITVIYDANIRNKTCQKDTLKQTN